MIPMVIVALGCSVQTLHMVQHDRYCKTDSEWKALYEAKAESSIDEDDS